MDHRLLRAPVIRPDDMTAYHALVVAGQERDRDAAIDAARRACILAPRNRQLRSNLLRLLHWERRWSDVVRAVPRSPRTLPPRQSHQVDLDLGVARYRWLMDRLRERADEGWTPSSIEVAKRRFPLDREHLARFRLSEVSGGTQTQPDRPASFRSLDFSQFYPPYDERERDVAGAALRALQAGLLGRLFHRGSPGIDYFDALALDDGRFGGRTVELSGVGPVTSKSLQSAYYACRLATLVPRGGVVLEIGGGFGAVAARLMELRPDITCILSDLPVNMVLTHTYLASLYGQAVAGLWEDGDRPAAGHRALIVPPWRLAALPMKVDLAVNTMSFQHMDARNHDYYGSVLRALGTRLLYHVNRNVFRSRDPARDTMAVPADRFSFMADYDVIERRPYDDLWIEVIARARG